MTERGESTHSNSTNCVIVGAGPAGMVLGLLLARRGVRVSGRCARQATPLICSTTGDRGVSNEEGHVRSIATSTTPMRIDGCDVSSCASR